MSKKKGIHSTTQDFVEIVDIKDELVLFKNRSAVSVLEVSSVNFFLLSSDEQNARIYGYMSLLNSLSHSIQIIIISKKIDLSAYLKLLDDRIVSLTNPRIKEHLTLYKDFIQEIIKGEDLLDKKVYIVIPFNSLELGAIGNAKSKNAASFSQNAQNALVTKRNNVMAQVQRIGLNCRVLSTEELIKLFYEELNDQIITLDFNAKDVKNVIL